MDKIERKSHRGLTAGLGFDCAHAGDYMPMDARLPGFNITGRDIYRDHDYVVGCLKHMIDAYLDG